MISALVAFLPTSSEAQVEDFAIKDTCYTPAVDGVFIDLDSYLSITYELEKIEILKKELPAIKDSLDNMQILVDSVAAAHSAEAENLTTIIALETQSKEELKNRVFNLQHNYNIMWNTAAKYKRQRNLAGGVGGGVLALLLGIVLIN